MWTDVSHAESDRFSALFDGHAAHLYDYCRSLVADRLKAEQAAQATLVMAYSLVDRLQDIGRLRAWLLTLARLECQRAVYIWALLPPPEPANSEPDTEELRRWMIEGHGRTAVAALNALPAPEREVLDLVYRHYLSSADVAAVLGVSADRASALLAGALASFDRAQQVSADGSTPNSTGTTAQALVAGVRVISTIPLTALPPSFMAGASSMALDAGLASDYASLASTVGDLAPDGFPFPPDQGNGVRHKELLLDRTRRYRAMLQGAIQATGARLALLCVLLLVLGAGLAVLASSSSGEPKASTHDVGQSLGQKPGGPADVSARHPAPHLPITALLPKKQDQGVVLPMLPAAPTPSPAPSRKPHPTPSPTHKGPSPTPSATPTPASPSPTPTSPSPTPASPSPTPVSPSATPAATP